MEALLSFGSIGLIVGAFWVIASFFIPFFIWGMHSKTHQMARDLAEIKNTIVLLKTKVSAKRDDQVRDIG